jgi:hypothetical protein
LLLEQKVARQSSQSTRGIWISKPWRWWRGCKSFRVLGRALEQWLNADTSDHDGARAEESALRLRCD